MIFAFDVTKAMNIVHVNHKTKPKGFESIVGEYLGVMFQNF